MSRQTQLIVWLLIAALLPGTIVGQYASRSARSRETAIARSSVRSRMSTARKNKRETPAKQESKLVIGVEEFIQKSLEGSVNLGDDPEAGDIALIETLIPKCPNWNELPPYVQQLIQRNKEMWFFYNAEGRQKTYPYVVLWGKHRSIQRYDGRFIVYQHHLAPEIFMGVFNPQIPGKPAFVIPPAKLEAMSEEDRVYANKLSAVINDNINFLYRAPFFVPDMELFDANIYGGMFIPEKLFVKGKDITKIPKGVVVPELLDLYTILGYPVWEPWTVEPSRITYGGCQWNDQCHLLTDAWRLRALPRLTVINYDGIQYKEKALALIRKTQYNSAMASSTAFIEGITAELEKQSGNLDRELILKVALKQVRRLDEQLQKTLQQALTSGKFIYRLDKPNAKPPKRSFNLVGPNYTDGYVPKKK